MRAGASTARTNRRLMENKVETVCCRCGEYCREVSLYRKPDSVGRIDLSNMLCTTRTGQHGKRKAVAEECALRLATGCSLSCTSSIGRSIKQFAIEYRMSLL